MLSLGVLSRHINQVVTDITMGPVISDAWALLNNKDLKQTVADHMGVDVVNGLDMWIKDIAVGEIAAGDWVSRTMRNLRTSVSVAAMGWNLGTTLLQLSGFTQTAAQVGKGRTLLALSQFLASPIGAYRKVEALSPFMQERTKTFQRDMADAMSRARSSGAIKGKMMAAYFFPIAKMQMMVDIPTWLAGYNKAVKLGMDGQEAIDYADNTVTGAQGSSLFSDLSAFERGSLSSDKRLSETTKALGTFYSYFNTKLNLAMRRTRETNFRNPMEVANLLADYAMIFWVEALIADLLRGFPTWFDDDDGDDEDKDAMQIIGHQLHLTIGNIMGTVPMLREMSSAMSGFGAGPAYSRSLEEVGRGVVAGSKAVKALFDEDEDADWIKIIKAGIAAGNVVSPFKVPAGMINRFIDGLEQSSEGNDVSPAEYFMKRPK